MTLGEIVNKRQLDLRLEKAEAELQSALRVLDYLLKESAATLFGYERKPNHKERCYANAKSLDVAHEKIEKCKKELFQFKLKHGE